MHSDWNENTGNCPAHHDAVVEVQFRSGGKGRAKISSWDWSVTDARSDITHWRYVAAESGAVCESHLNVQDTLSERGSRYGDFYDNAGISQSLQAVMRSAPSYNNMTPLHIEGLTAIMQKIARILNGDPNYADNWHDIQGYARLVEERLPK